MEQNQYLYGPPWGIAIFIGGRASYLSEKVGRVPAALGDTKPTSIGCALFCTELELKYASVRIGYDT